MRSQRIALQLATAGAAVISLLGGTMSVAMASTDPATAAKIAPSAATAVCSISVTGPAPKFAAGARICSTTPVFIDWGFNSSEYIVIGTTFKVYHDTGSGWSVLQNGSVLPDTSKVLGVSGGPTGTDSSGFATAVTIAVFGTTGHTYCNSKSRGGGWGGWTTKNCFQGLGG